MARRVANVNFRPSPLGDLIDLTRVGGNSAGWFTFRSWPVTGEGGKRAGGHGANRVADGTWSLLAVMKAAAANLHLELYLFARVVAVLGLIGFHTLNNVW